MWAKTIGFQHLPGKVNSYILRKGIKFVELIKGVSVWVSYLIFYSIVFTIFERLWTKKK